MLTVAYALPICIVFIISIVLVAVLRHFSNYIQTLECQFSKFLQSICTVLPSEFLER